MDSLKDIFFIDCIQRNLGVLNNEKSTQKYREYLMVIFARVNEKPEA